MIMPVSDKTRTSAFQFRVEYRFEPEVLALKDFIKANNELVNMRVPGYTFKRVKTYPRLGKNNPHAWIYKASRNYRSIDVRHAAYFDVYVHEDYSRQHR